MNWPAPATNGWVDPVKDGAATGTGDPLDDRHLSFESSHWPPSPAGDLQVTILHSGGPGGQGNGASLLRSPAYRSQPQRRRAIQQVAHDLFVRCLGRKLTPDVV